MRPKLRYPHAKIEAGASNINESTTRRLASLEMQVHEIRVKSALDPPAAA